MDTEENKLANLLTILCMLGVFVLTCFPFVCNYTQATLTHSSLMLISFHFPASLPITLILNKEKERKCGTECWGEKKLENVQE